MFFGTQEQALGAVNRYYGRVGIFPNRSEADDDVRAFVARCKGGIECPPWDEGWFRGLQRKYRPPNDVGAFSPIASGLPRQSIGLALSVLPPAVRLWICDVFVWFDLPSRSNGELFVLLKELGELAKHHGPLAFGDRWRYLVDWHLHFGAEPTDGGAKAGFREMIEDWVLTAKPEDVPGCERERFILRGLAMVRERLVQAGVRPKDRSAADWALNPSVWLVNGSSSDTTCLPETRPTKFSSYLQQGPDHIVRLLDDAAPVTYQVFDKREKGKHRNIVSTPWSMYLQMSFLGDGLEDEIYKVVPTSLRRGFGFEDWFSWSERLGSHVLVPIDQSKFDHVPSARVLQAAFELVVSLASVTPERARVGQALLSRLPGCSVEYDGVKMAHSRGLLSGWRWTALLGTLINYGEYLSACDVVGYAPRDSGACCFQGDDALFEVSDWSEVFNMVQTYRAVLPVNPSKFFVRRRETEFLRKVVGHGYRFGYYARAMSSVFVASASSGGMMDPASVAAGWSLAVSRGADPVAAELCCVRDISGLLRCPHADSQALLRTPVSCGGLGYGVPGSRRVRMVSPPVIVGGERQRAVTMPEDLPRSARLAVERTVGVLAEALALPVSGVRVVKGLVAGLVLKRAVDKKRVFASDAGRGEPVLESVVGSGLLNGWSTRRPRSRLDPLFLEAALEDALKTGLSAVLDLFPGDEAHVAMLWRRLPRWCFFRLCLEPINLTVGKVMGDASDVLNYVRRKLELAWGVLPRGCITKERLAARSLSFELFSRSLFFDMRRNFRD